MVGPEAEDGSQLVHQLFHAARAVGAVDLFDRAGDVDQRVPWDGDDGDLVVLHVIRTDHDGVGIAVSVVTAHEQEGVELLLTHQLDGGNLGLRVNLLAFVLVRGAGVVGGPDRDLDGRRLLHRRGLDHDFECEIEHHNDGAYDKQENIQYLQARQGNPPGRGRTFPLICHEASPLSNYVN